MKKQKSSTIVLSEFSSSDDETEKAMPKIDKEELRKYLQNSDDESSQNKTSPQKSKRVLHKIKTSSQDKLKKLIPKDTPQNYFRVQGEDFKKLQKKTKKLGAVSLEYSKRKNHKYLVEDDNKKIHFGSANTEDYLTHKDPVRRDKYLTKAKKITDKDGRFTHELPFYPNLLVCQSSELEKKF